MVDAYRSKPNLTHIGNEPVWKRAKKWLMPVMNQLLVQLLPEEQSEDRKIILPDNAKSREVVNSQRFLVIAAGPDCQQVKEGNVVVGLIGVNMHQPPGVRHKGEILMVLVETQCASVECDEEGKTVVMQD